MSHSTEVLCDGCGADLTTTGNSEDWRLALVSQAKMPWYIAEGMRSGAVTDLAIAQPIQGDKHFCGLRCLRSWLVVLEEPSPST